MKVRFVLLLTLLGLSPTALAHDPSQHKANDAAPPDCAKMKDMDMSEMDMNDPVMKAMHAKCKDWMEHGSREHDKTSDDDKPDEGEGHQ